MQTGISAGELHRLVGRILAGDRSAENELVHQFSRQIFVMGLVRTHDSEAARDLVQDVLVAVILALRKGQLQDPEKLAAFVHGTTRNLINNQFRTQRVQVEPLSEDIARSGFDEQLEHNDRMQIVQKALETLGQQDRDILRMTLVEDRKPGEIAATLGLSSDVVRTRKLRATKKVADFVKKRMSQT